MPAAWQRFLYLVLLLTMMGFIYMPGFAYQIGMVCAGVAPYVETVIGEHLSYAQSMGYLAAAALVLGMLVIWFGPEGHGVEFRKAR
jgi:SHS family lactate transporter-like MFS transporter